jgi:NADPH:quinone reductase-like Zn-dependent oxidoreductase
MASHVNSCPTKEDPMKAVQLIEYGAPEVLQIRDIPTPEAGPGQVLVRVEAAGVNFADTVRRRNDPFPEPTPLPYVLGSEIAGIVESVGAGVEYPTPGTRVFGFAGIAGEGGYAEFAVMSAASAIPVPTTITSDQAAGLMVTSLSALLIVREAGRLRAGETIFVPAASGGLGTMAVRISKLLGATVIGGAGTAEKRERAREAGADAVVDHRADSWVQDVRELTGGRGADVVLDAVGPAHVGASVRALAPFGRAVTFGKVGGVEQVLDPEALETLLYDPAAGQSITGFNLSEWFTHRPEIAFTALQDFVTWVADGTLTVPQVTAYPLEAAATVHRLIDTAKTHGKVVLNP